MITAEQLIESNHWWRTGKVKEELALPYKRALFNLILKYLKLRQAIGIVGLRRVGKTTLFYQLIDYLLKAKVNPKHIIYFSFDEAKAELRELFRIYEENILKKRIENERIYVFLDEVQKLEGWQNKVKIFYDLYPNLKFFISGSASLDILLKAKESLAGRIFYFYLDLLSFEEFLELKRKSPKQLAAQPELWKREARIELNNYLLRPFPEIVRASSELAAKYIKESIVDRIILRDLREMFEIRELEALEKVLALIAANPGLILNLDDLAKDFGISRQTLSNYLYYLECSFLLKSLRNFRSSIRAASRKLKKYYLAHPCFSLALTSVESSKIAENAVLFKTKADLYWREAGMEVDFVLRDKELLPIEVKYKKEVREKELKALLKFMDKFNSKRALVITEDYEAEKFIERKKISFIPLWKLFLANVHAQRIAKSKARKFREQQSFKKKKEF